MSARPRSTYAVGIDIGSNRVRCVAGAIEERRLRFLGASTAPSEGWHRGRVHDVNLVSESLRTAVKQLEATVGFDIEGAVIGVGGPAVESTPARGVYEFNRPREIVEKDLSYAVELAARMRLEEDRMLLHVLPQEFTVDGKAGCRSPVGAQCQRLEANVRLVTMSEKEHGLLVAAAHKAHLIVEDTASEPVAAAYASIQRQERQRGAALLDIGLHSTEIVVYDGESAVGAASLPVSADHFTRDLMMAFHELHGHTISYDDAETLKCDFGCALLGLSADNVTVEVPSADGRTSHAYSRRQINEILEARAAELFDDYVRKYLASTGMDRGLMEGIFLTGGGARLDGMLDMAERVLNCPARYALTQGIQEWPRDFQDQAWTTAAGLALYAARLKLDKGGRRPGFWGWLGW